MSTTITIRETARRLGVHENTVRRYVDRGLLRAERLPSGVRRVRLEDVARLAPVWEDELGHEMTTEEIFSEPGKFNTGQEALDSAPKLFDSDEELEEFVNWIYEQRRRDV
jgi:excisionase family DNA binding protein